MVTIRIGLGLALLLPFWVGAIGWLSGRILGVRIGRLRAAFAATLGWLLGVISTAVVLNGEDVGAGNLFLIVCFFAVLATMPLAVVLQLLTRREGTRPPGRGVLRHPIRRTKAALSPLGRFRELVGNARRENLVHVRYRAASALDSADFARRAARVLEESGGMFVKFGQIASTRTDLLPDDADRPSCQPPVRRAPGPGDEIRAVLEARARRAGGPGLRVVRRRAAGRRVDRPDPPRDAARTASTWWSRCSGPASTTRPPRRRRARLRRRAARQAGRAGAPRRGQAARRRADRRDRGELSYSHEATAGAAPAREPGG